MENEQIKLPIYLCHFTKLGSIISILESMTLRFSELSRSNDLKEKYLLRCFYSNFDLQLKSEINQYKYLSFCEGDEKNKGINHPRIWDQYGEKNQGVCIELDTKCLIEKNSFIRNRIIPIIYEENYFIREERSIDEELKYKHSDWQQEDEWRIIYNGDLSCIDIKDCVTRIYIGEEYSKRNDQRDFINDISDVIFNKKHSCYKNITPTHFWNTRWMERGFVIISNNLRTDVSYLLEQTEPIDYKIWLDNFQYNNRTIQRNSHLLNY